MDKDKKRLKRNRERFNECNPNYSKERTLAGKFAKRVKELSFTPIDYYDEELHKFMNQTIIVDSENLIFLPKKYRKEELLFCNDYSHDQDLLEFMKKGKIV